MADLQGSSTDLSANAIVDYSTVAVSELMEPVHAKFDATDTVGEAIEQIRTLVRSTFVTYAYVVDDDGKLVGVVTMRDLLFTDRTATLGAIMLKDPFWIPADVTVIDAMKLVIKKHFPVYPVCLGSGQLVGLIRGTTMFEAQAV
jgi:magnesium transporter